MNQFSSIILKVWAVLLLVSLLIMGSVPVFTFGAVCYGLLGLFWLREWRRGGSAPLMEGGMILLCLVWFIFNTFLELTLPIPGWSHQHIAAVMMAMAFLFPPLIFHAYAQDCRREGTTGKIWKATVLGLWTVCLGAATYIVLLIAGWVTYLGDETWFVLAILLCLGFVTAGTASAVLLGRRQRTPLASPATTADRRQQKFWNFFLLGLMVVFFILIFLDMADFTEGFTGTDSLVSYISRSLPLLFLFVNSYYEKRFEFFDVFIKKSTIFFLTLIVLFAYFSLVSPLFSGTTYDSVRTWLLALTLLPVVLILPWLFRKIETWMDQAWLGRRFSTEEAVQFFSSSVRSATSVADLVEEAEAGLREIFQAPAHISLDLSGGAKEPDFEVAEEVSVPSYRDPGGRIAMGERRNRTPYFSGDLTMLSACAEVFAYMRESIRLQQKKQQQEKREQELILHASESELKALRAQINPHFLFNALNAIASLISRDPDRAEEIVEELSEVFRYTLRRSEKEWVRLEDEIAFIRSYLKIEKARFGKRLEVSIEVDSRLNEVPVPSMMVQTLVENAVKHGVASIKGTGRIEVHVFRGGDSLEIQVADNGPGPQDGRQPVDLKEHRKSTGYGLGNIRQRLQGYFGGSAEFTLSRDAKKELTVARIRIPLEPLQVQEMSS